MRSAVGFMPKRVLRTMLNLHHLISIKIATEKMEFVFVAFVYNIERGLNFASLGANTYTVTFEKLLCPLLACPGCMWRSPSLARICQNYSLGLDGRWRRLLSGEMEENLEVEQASASGIGFCAVL